MPHFAGGPRQAILRLVTEYNSGKLFFIFILAVLLSCVAAWLIARRYRAAMARLMRASVCAERPAPDSAAAPRLPLPDPVSLADNQRAGRRLALLLIGLSVLIVATAASLWWWLAFPGELWPPTRVAAVALLQLWPVVPALGLLWRWSRWRIFGALMLWCVLAFLVLLWRSIEPRPLQLLAAMASEMGFSLVIVAFMTLGSSTRPIAPWLLLPFTGLVGASFLGMEWLANLAERRAPVLMWMSERADGWTAAFTVIAAFILVPGLLAWWPLRWLGRALGRAYSRKWLSELLVVFTAVWSIALLDKAMTSASWAGIRAATMLLPLLWIPPVVLLTVRLRGPSGRPPTLLVLRVFQQDARVQDLFDHVIERWRLSGNIVMIAGTDLATRTLDGEDLFMFLDRRLPERFVGSPSDVASRLASFDTAPDADGRFRVNECYCHDSTWQAVLKALVERTDAVLMDLRRFKAHNAGCRFELEELARAARPLRVTVLVDDETDGAAAEACVAGGRTERFTWIDTQRIDARKRQEVLASLFAASSVAGCELTS